VPRVLVLVVLLLVPLVLLITPPLLLLLVILELPAKNLERLIVIVPKDLLDRPPSLQQQPISHHADMA
jgi:hypothetical protein